MPSTRNGALSSAPKDRQVKIALGAFFYATIPMLLGIVTFAAGVKSAIAHLSDAATIETATALGVGVALCLGGEAIFVLLVALIFVEARGRTVRTASPK